MGNGAVGGVPSQLNHLLAREHRLANHRLFVALFAQFFEQTGRLFLIGIGKEHVPSALLGFHHRRAEVDLTRLSGDV